jgi:hypothetical protein
MLNVALRLALSIKFNDRRPKTSEKNIFKGSKKDEKFIRKPILRQIYPSNI